jgi:hypothetical protein
VASSSVEAKSLLRGIVGHWSNAATVKLPLVEVLSWLDQPNAGRSEECLERRIRYGWGTPERNAPHSPSQCTGRYALGLTNGTTSSATGGPPVPIPEINGVESLSPQSRSQVFYRCTEISAVDNNFNLVGPKPPTCT